MLEDIKIFTASSFISRGLSLPWSFSAYPRNHHLDTRQDALTLICSCSLWLVSVASCKSLGCLLPPRKRDKEELILTCPSIVPPSREVHLTDLLFFFPLSQSLILYCFQLNSPVFIWSQDRASTGNTWASRLVLLLLRRHNILTLYKHVPCLELHFRPPLLLQIRGKASPRQVSSPH